MFTLGKDLMAAVQLLWDMTVIEGKENITCTLAIGALLTTRKY